MDHSIYTISFTAIFKEDVPTNVLKLEEDLLNSIMGFPHSALDLVELEAEDNKPCVIIAKGKISPQDYGVVQIGIELVAQWCESLFKNHNDYYFSEIIIHPTEESHGALLQYDYSRKELIIKRLS